MASRVHLSWSPRLGAYDFGPGHPMNPVRLRLTMALVSALGLLDSGDVVVVEPEVADDGLLGLVHTPEYIAAVRATEEGYVDPRRGLGTSDDPVFPHMHEASARVVGATVAAARAVWTGTAAHGVSIAGGLHHAMPDHASGFCVYNDVAVAIRWLLRHGAHRVAYIDVDAHHGDGVEHVFADDPRVLTISVHQSGTSLFPGTGFPTDIGVGEARGTAVNVGLPPGTGDAGWLRAIDSVVRPLVAEFSPEVVVSQHGCDAHVRDPLTQLRVSLDAQRAAALEIATLARRHAQGRWVATGGGGYAVADVVPRAWAHLVAIVAGRPVDPATPVPEAWAEAVVAAGFEPPATMSDGAAATFAPWHTGYDPGSAVDRAILATRAATFPWHGLDPYSST